ncbi:MAG TPA: aromatic amino acid lyase [Streptosporangiaceae bacterium]|nr:aromatic amino acid lyase [Streptosporangiaceae bacterium]
MSVITITQASDPDLDVIRAIAAGQAVSVGPELLNAVQQRCDQARQLLRDGRPVYGVNTGMGALHHVRLTTVQQRAHQRNLLLARATGGPPWLEEPEARAVIAVRLLTFLSGDAAVSADLCRRLAEMLSSGIVPAIPRTGMGAAGEIMQLAHAFGPLAGIGQVLDPSGDLRPAAQALQDLGASEFSLGPKEGIALLQGVPGTTGLAVLRLHDAANLTSLMEASAALSIAVIGASRDPYSAACGRGDDVLAAVLHRIRAAVGEDAQARSLQAPVSFRVAGQVLAQLHRAAGLLEAAVMRALTGVTDSPAFVGDRFIGTAGFYGIDLAAHCDQLTASFCHAAEVAVARIHRLLDPAVTGLPPQLARQPGLEAGLAPVHKRAAGEVHAMRALASATPVGLIETSGGQEDVQSYAWEAVSKLRTALRHAHAVTACELLTAYQAAALSSDPLPPGCQPLVRWLTGILGPITGDRPFGPDIEHLLNAGRPHPEP